MSSQRAWCRVFSRTLPVTGHLGELGNSDLPFANEEGSIRFCMFLLPPASLKQKLITPCVLDFRLFFCSELIFAVGVTSIEDLSSGVS